MYFENKTLENLVADQEEMEEVLRKYGLECHGGWDFDRMTFDRRFDLNEGTYYLRVPALAVSGDVGAKNAVLKFLKPAIGKHYYPHGVEYGEDEVFPRHLVEKCEEILENAKKDFAALGIEA